MPRLGHSPDPQVEPIERGLANVGKRNELAGRRLPKVRNVEQRELGERASTAATPGISAIWSTSVFGAAYHRKNVGKCIAVVIGGPGLVERPVGSHGQTRVATPPAITNDMARAWAQSLRRSRNSLMSRTAIGSPGQFGRSPALFILAYL